MSDEEAEQERERALREKAWDDGLREGWEGEIPPHLWSFNPYRSKK